MFGGYQQLTADISGSLATYQSVEGEWCGQVRTYNPAMPSFLAAHVHWLWQLLHTAKHPYSTVTLLLFMVVGALQTFVAIKGGALAVETLNAKPRIKKEHKRQFVCFGFALLIATVWTGLLNDENQRATDGRATTLEAQLTQLSNSVLTSDKLKDELDKHAASSTSPAELSQLKDQFQQARNLANGLARLYATVPQPTSNNKPQPPVPTPAPQATPQNIFPQPQSRSAVPTPASVQANIEQTLKKLADIDRTADFSVQMTLSPIRSMYIMGGGFAGPGQQSREQAFRNTIPQLEGIVKNRNDAFQRLLPEINQERTDAHGLLKLSGQDVAADQADFATVLGKSNAKITYPDNWQQSMPLYRLTYSDMNAYLSGLEQRLKTLK
ncbi:hypothetical protein [Tunturiibacter psychrotolerans]|uniref:hypothetical protein n=1 Tax=Tunturiibacter psychrotolerans TaxID=3069686 RepID=UPI003D1C7140